MGAFRSPATEAKPFAIGPEPALDRIRGPLRRSIGVAIVAGVWRAVLHGQIRPRNPQAVIVAGVNHHVSARRHVARNAIRRGIRLLMTAVLCPGVELGCVALETDAIAGNSLLGAVRVMTIAAGHACRKHLALLEWHIVIGLGDIPHLAVGPIDVSCKRYGNRMRVLKPVPRHPFLGHFAATRMAAAAGFNFCS